MLAPSTSQRHIAILCNAILRSQDLPSPIRVLDMGCGDGHLLAFLAQALPAQHPDCNFEFYGFEVGDIGWHGSDYLSRTVAFLNDQAPGRPWAETITVFSASDCWPYADQSFDVIVSNQVLEHVQEHATVFGEICRCLTRRGVSVHLFPLGETIYEVHAHMPIVHWIRDHRQRQKFMLIFAMLGFRRKYKEEMNLYGWKTLKEFAAKYSEVLGNMTNYKSSDQIARLAESAGLKVEFSHTKDFFWTKLLSMIGRVPDRYDPPTWVDKAGFALLKRMASVTLILRQNANLDFEALKSREHSIEKVTKS